MDKLYNGKQEANLSADISALAAPSQPAELVKLEALRQEQAAMVMPLIGPLLDAWDGMSRDARSDLQSEAPSLTSNLQKIAAAMESESQPAEPVAQAKWQGMPLDDAYWLPVAQAEQQPIFEPCAKCVAPDHCSFFTCVAEEPDTPSHPAAEQADTVTVPRTLLEWAQQNIDCVEDEDERNSVSAALQHYLDVGSHPAAEQESERAAFEAWAKAEGYDPEPWCGGMFLDDATRAAWAAWQAARRPVRELSDAEIWEVFKSLPLQPCERFPISYARALLARATGEGGQ